MPKETFQFTATRVIYDTSLSVDAVLARLDSALSRDASGPALFELLRRAQTREEIEDGIQGISQGNDLMYVHN